MNPTSQPTPMAPNTDPASSPQGNPVKQRSAKRLLVIIVALVVLIAAGVATWWWLDRDASTEETAAAVIVKDSGFEPATIQIKKGQDVTWTNESESSHHIYADQAVIAGLDSQEPLSNGDTYTFTFEKPGTYHYYDSLNPKLNATVVVEE